MDKNELRAKIRNQRDMLCETDRLHYSGIIMDKVFSHQYYKEAHTIMCFASFGSEVNTFPLLHGIISEGKCLILPKVVKENGIRVLDIYKVYDPQTQLIKGSFGIMEPNPLKCEKEALSDIDLVICPGLVFDIKCNRIGYGAGFYDRLFASSAGNLMKLGIAFDMQIVESIISDRYDVPMDCVVTEKREIRAFG